MDYKEVIIEKLVGLNLDKKSAIKVVKSINEELLIDLRIVKVPIREFKEECTLKHNETARLLQGIRIAFGVDNLNVGGGVQAKGLRRLPSVDSGNPCIVLKQTPDYNMILMYLPPIYDIISLDNATYEYVNIDTLLANVHDDMKEKISLLKILSNTLCGYDRCIKLSYEFDSFFQTNVLTYASIGWGELGSTSQYGYCNWDLKNRKCEYYSDSIDTQKISFKNGISKAISLILMTGKL